MGLEWLVRLRWGTALGQAAMILAARALVGPELPLARLLTVVAILAISNVGLRTLAPRTRTPRVLCGGALALDTVLLTALLQASGGAYNPFSVLYLVYIALAAVVLRARWTWFLAGLSVVCYGLLFASERPGPPRPRRDPSAHLQGMWVAFTVAAVLTAYFVVKLTAPRAARGGDGRVRERAARHERLAAVTTLAAGAAHELARRSRRSRSPAGSSSGRSRAAGARRAAR